MVDHVHSAPSDQSATDEQGDGLVRSNERQYRATVHPRNEWSRQNEHIRGDGRMQESAYQKQHSRCSGYRYRWRSHYQSAQ